MDKNLFRSYVWVLNFRRSFKSLTATILDRVAFRLIIPKNKVF